MMLNNLLTAQILAESETIMLDLISDQILTAVEMVRKTE